MKLERVLLHGAIAGFLAGATLIAMFTVTDFLRAQPLGTPTFLSGALLGRALPNASFLRLGLYTVAHFGVFVVLGVVAALFFATVPVPRSPALGGVYGLFSCSVVLYSAMLVTGTDLTTAPAWPIMFLGNLTAGVVIVGYLDRTTDKDSVTEG